MTAPGRSCPFSYRYDPCALRWPAEVKAEALWIAGGLYGNTFALDALLEAYAEEAGDKALAFNGDFHWFDVDPADFECVNETVLAFHATRGNIEAELAAPQPGAGCGCAYPEWVGEATVGHSNRIIERLRKTARASPGIERLAALPMHLVAEVAGVRIGIVHGDAHALAGWGFSQEALATEAGRAAAERAFDAAGVEVFASSHTCLPVLQRFSRERAVVNNGSAGMPNFRGERFGVVTRIAVRPHRAALYRTSLCGVHVEAMPVHYNARRWEQRFLEQWPSGSDAHASYWDRIARGPAYRRTEALRA
jgi:hypothetical protein